MALPQALSEHHDNRFDFLRLLAAWLVLFSHSFPLGGWPHDEPLARTLGFDTFGGIGVCIFFVLSGYLVTQSLERSHKLQTFAWRRIIRIYPALLTAVVFCILVAGFWLSSLTIQQYFTHAQTWQYLWSATAWEIRYPLPGVFTHNPHPHAVNGSLWSLPYELSCYIVLGLLSLLPVAMRWKSLVALVFIITVWWLRPNSPEITVFYKTAGLDYFHLKLGMLFTLGAVLASWRHVVTLRVWYGPALIALAYFLPWYNLVLITFYLGVGALVLWLALYGRWLPVIPAKMGDWSYGTYLYGFPVQQWLAYIGFYHYGVTAFVLASTVLTLMLAAASWYLVEKPVLRFKHLL